VVDFLNFSDVYFPYVFNIADVGINLGVAAIILDLLVNDRKPAADR
jgi:signal peptidase II